MGAKEKVKTIFAVNGGNRIRWNLWFIVIAMLWTASKEIEFFRGINDAHYAAVEAETTLAKIEADSKYTHNIIGATAFGILFTLLGGIAIRLVDEKPQPGPTVPLEVHQQVLENNALHTEHLAKIAHGMAYIPGVVEKVRTVADNLEKE